VCDEAEGSYQGRERDARELQRRQWWYKRPTHCGRGIVCSRAALPGDVCANAKHSGGAGKCGVPRVGESETRRSRRPKERESSASSVMDDACREGSRTSPLSMNRAARGDNFFQPSRYEWSKCARPASHLVNSCATRVGLPRGASSEPNRHPFGRIACEHCRTVQEYLAELEQQNPVAGEEEGATPQPMVSTTDPDAAWAVKNGPASLGYYDNYLVDTASRVILSVEATPARFRQEVLAARRILEHVAGLGIGPQNLAADKAYGSGEFPAWLLARDIQQHIPVIDRRHQTRGTSRSTFRD